MGYNEDGEPVSHLDAETEEQIEVKNLIVQYVTESPIIGDNKSRLEYELVGSGSGLVFIDGKVIASNVGAISVQPVLVTQGTHHISMHPYECTSPRLWAIFMR